MRVYVVRKWPLRGRSCFVCWNITRVSQWLLCNVQFVQSTERNRLQTRPCDLPDLKSRIIAAVKNIDAPILTCVCGKNLNTVSMCAVSPVVLTSNICSCQKRKRTKEGLSKTSQTTKNKSDVVTRTKLLRQSSHSYLWRYSVSSTR
jgi:hypothetical protein